MGSKTPFEYHAELELVTRASKENFVTMGRLLASLKNDDAYQEAQGGYETWQSYLAQPEIGLSVSEANRLIQIYDTFVRRFGFEEEHIATVPIKNLHYLLPIAKDMEDREEVGGLLDDAASLSQRDFKERLQDYKNDDGVRTYQYIIMQKCLETGGLRKVHDYSPEDVDIMIQRFEDSE